MPREPTCLLHGTLSTCFEKKETLLGVSGSPFTPLVAVVAAVGAVVVGGDGSSSIVLCME